VAVDFSFLAGREPAVIAEGKALAAAVCILLLDTPDGPAVLFEKRSEKIDQQPGDICFPGGAVEAGETPEQAAVREATEELLVSPDQIEVLGPGDLLVSDNAQIYSYIGRLQNYDGRFSADEVSEIFSVPLEFFLRTQPATHTVSWTPEFGWDFPFEKIYGGRQYRWGSRALSVLFYEYEGRVIWGLTAKLLHAFVELCRRAGL